MLRKLSLVSKIVALVTLAVVAAERHRPDGRP